MRPLVLIAALFFFVMPLFAQSHTKRLILKDGTYQSITEYQTQGANIHYHSAERYQWEDIPSDLIDWDATNKYNANPIKNDRSRDRRDELTAVDEEAAESEDVAPTVAPHLRLPESKIGGVYLLDEWKGHPELAEIVQNGAELTGGSRKNVLHVALGSQRKVIELPDAHARVQSHSTTPVFYLCVEGGNPMNVATQYRILRVQPDEGRKTRTIATVNVKLSGKTSENQKFVPATAAKINQGAWIKVTPDQPLEPGEYAVVEMLSNTEVNSYVWDFGVNPSAPENLNPKIPTQ
ncbi:MAG TPA: hypothetical protein VGL89_19820 [Candidatus Koribacter sp.]|jgi:hypothetical protein